MQSFWKKGEKKFKKSTADRHFSNYIRLRDSSSNGYFLCITCGKPIFWKNGDCGHFVTRNHPKTRFDTRNCNAQCKGCNNFKSGDQWNHGKAIDRKYGEGTADSLIDLGSIRGQKIHGQLALKDIAKEFRLLAKAEAKKKGIES